MADLLAQRGLDHVTGLRGAGEAASVGHGEDVPHLMELHPIIIADDRCHRNHVLDRSWWLGSGWSHAKTTAHTLSGHGVRDHPWRYRPDRSPTERLEHHLPSALLAHAARPP